jgi:hypothetical protein
MIPLLELVWSTADNTFTSRHWKADASPTFAKGWTMNQPGIK